MLDLIELEQILYGQILHGQLLQGHSSNLLRFGHNSNDNNWYFILYGKWDTCSWTKVAWTNFKGTDGDVDHFCFSFFFPQNFLKNCQKPGLSSA